MCNNENKSEFKKTQNVLLSNKIVRRKTSYLIEAFRIVKINVQTLKAQQNIELLNVALALRFILNLVSLAVINTKGAYWNSEKLNYIKRNSKVLYYLEKISLY